MPVCNRAAALPTCYDIVVKTSLYTVVQLLTEQCNTWVRFNLIKVEDYERSSLRTWRCLHYKVCKRKENAGLFIIPRQETGLKVWIRH